MKLAGVAAMSSGVPCAMTRPPPSPPSGPRSIDPVGGLDDVEVVLDHDHGVAVVAQAVQHAQQQVDVVEVQPRGRLVEDVERAAGVALGQLERELHALRLAAGERGGALPEPDVAEAHLEQRLRACLAIAGTAAKNSWASSTVMSSTSWMLRPL